MLDPGIASFVRSPEAANPFRIPVGERIIEWTASDFRCQKIPTKGSLTVASSLYCGNHETLDEKDPAFGIMKKSSDYVVSIPAWYHNQHQAQGITTGHLYFPNCSSKCFRHGLLHPEYEITYDGKVALKPNAIDMGAIIVDNSSIIHKLPKDYHTWLLLFDPEESDKLPRNKGCDHQIELQLVEGNLRMGPIDQLFQEEVKSNIQYMNRMIKEEEIRPSSSAVGRQILFIPKPNTRGFQLCVDYRHLNQHTQKDNTPLLIMSKLQGILNGAYCITIINLKSDFH